MGVHKRRLYSDFRICTFGTNSDFTATKIFILLQKPLRPVRGRHTLVLYIADGHVTPQTLKVRPRRSPDLANTKNRVKTNKSIFDQFKYRSSIKPPAYVFECLRHMCNTYKAYAKHQWS